MAGVLVSRPNRKARCGRTIVVAPHELDVAAELVCVTGVAGRAPAQVRRRLPNREVEALDERGVQGLGILRRPQRGFQSIRRADLSDPDVWVANYYSARNPLRLSSLVILGVVARMFRCATRSSCWCT